MLRHSDVKNETATHFAYTGDRARSISFPLGGIGAGSIGLSGTGRLVDWEIFNRPNKNSYNGFSFFAVRAEHRGEVILAKLLNGELGSPYSGAGEEKYRGFGFGVARETGAGFPHFKRSEFVGQFPFADVSFEDEDVPVKAVLRAFSPLIPLNDRDSSLPAALLTYEVTNSSDRQLEVTVVGNITNPFKKEPINKYFERQGVKGIKLSSAAYAEDDPNFGDLSITTSEKEVSYQNYWYRGEWFDNLTVFWKDFTTPGRFINRDYDGGRAGGKILTYNFQDVCLLAVHKSIAPGETATFQFALTWSFPNFVNYWNPGRLEAGAKPPHWRNYYATLFESSVQTADYLWSNFDRLYQETRRFKESLFSSTLPDYVLDAISSNLGTMKSPTCVRLTDGTLYGFEGCHATEGCCEGSCTHVWNYEQAFPYLFPELSRSMRELEYRYNQYPNGKMAFRTLLPPERTLQEKSQQAAPGRAAADGQMGGILKTYREWWISGDTEWLKAIWPKVKKSLEYSWEPTNEDWWDKDRDGVMEGVQHHTLDVEMYGPNSYITGLYLAALLAAAQMAEAVGELDTAVDYRRLALQGREWVESNLFNGEYFHQKIDLKDSRFPVDSELGEIKYQIGTGCHVDQVIGQWHAHMLGLGYVMDERKIKSAIRAVYNHNFISMQEHANADRIYALNDEKGLVICTWPRGNAPLVPVPYADECMNGFEYQAACHLIYEGYIAEGLEVVRAVRERYDGERRNPWNEIECGSNYARSLASYALLLALSGFEHDARIRYLGFRPKINREDFSCFWSLGSGWGTFRARKHEGLVLAIDGGEMRIGSFGSDYLGAAKAAAVKVRGSAIGFSQQGDRLTLDVEAVLQAGESLVIEIG